jgi:uncharacterized protein (DUF58 family)
MIVNRLKVNIALKKNLLFTVIILVFFLQAYLHDKNITYIFIFFIVGIVIINNIFLKRNLKGLEIELLEIQNRFAQEESIIKIEIINTSAVDRFDIWLDDKLRFDIRANSNKNLYLKRSFEHRGRLKSLSIEISSTFPLNMFDRYYAVMKFEGNFIIYPARRGKSLNEAFGNKKELFGIQEDFKGTREYRDGDKASLIYWKSLAKGELRTKEFEYTTPFDGYIFDFESIDGDVEERLSQITLWVTEADRAEQDFIVKLKGITLNSKETDIETILETLALLPSGTEKRRVKSE